MFRFWIFIAFLSIFKWSAAQTVINYSEKDGLPSNHVYKITQDLDGFIWIATDEGLVKYNGTDFKIFTTKDGLPTNDIFDMYPANDGRLWYVSKSTSLGYILDDVVYDFQNENEEVSFNPIFTGFTGKDVIISSSITSHILNKNNTWEQMQYYDESYIHQGYLINDRYKGIVISKDIEPELSIVTQNNKYIKLQNTKFIHQGYHRLQLTDSLFISKTNTTYGFLNLNNLESKIYNYKDQLGIDSLKLCRVHLVNDQIQLSGENIVAVLDKDLRASKVIPIPEEWKSHFSFVDKENTVWAASFTKGIYKYSIHEDVLKKEFKDIKINDIKRVDDKIIALVNGKGFYEYDYFSQSFIPFLKTSTFLFDALYLKETNSAYFFTRENIQIMKDGVITQTPRNNGILGEIARSVVYYKGVLYGHDTNGVNKIDANELKLLEHHYLNSARCEISFQDKLIVGVSNGLYVLENDKFKMLAALSDFKKPVIDLLAVNKNILLVTTAGYGIYTTNLDSIELLEGSDYLKSSNPYNEDNHLYLPTNKGVYHYEWIEGKFRLKNIWNKTNGLSTNKINGVEKVGNVLLVATNQGIIHFPLDYQTEQNLLGLYVENASYANLIIANDTFTDYSADGDFQVTISSIDFRNNKKLDYEFKLSPTQDNWTQTASSNLRFSDLSPANYQLAIRSEGVKKSFNFVVTPQWYQTWWFYALILLGGMGIIIFITKTLTKNSEKKKNKDLLQAQKLSELQLKALRSQMNPHFVFNSLTAIQYYINENDFETSDIYLVKFSRLVREFFELSKEQFITIEREVLLLKNYLDLEKLRFKSKLNYEVIVDPILNTKDKLPSMLLQPIVENAVNHGVFNKDIPGTVIIKFKKLSKQHILIHVIDDGIGYTINKQDKRYKSSTVLDDRIKYLNDSGLWDITVTRGAVTTDKEYPGHEVIFDIKKMKNENL